MEADSDLNAASRGVIKAMFAEHGTAWLYEINRGLSTGVQWDGDAPLFNFCATIVMPRRVPEIEALIQARRDEAYTGTAKDGGLVDRIFQCGTLHGGEILSWS